MASTYDLKERLRQHFDEEAFMSIFDSSTMFETHSQQVIEAFEMLIQDYKDEYSDMMGDGEQDFLQEYGISGYDEDWKD